MRGDTNTGTVKCKCKNIPSLRATRLKYSNVFLVIFLILVHVHVLLTNLFWFQ